MKNRIPTRLASVFAAAALAATGAIALAAPANAEAIATARVTADGALTVRNAPSKYASANGAIPSGEVIYPACKADGTSVDGDRVWLLLLGDGGRWVSGRYVEELPGPTIPYCRGGDDEDRTSARTTAPLNVRQGPNRHDRVVGELKDAETVEVVCKTTSQSIGGNRDWYLLSDMDWISASYVDDVDDAPGNCVQR